ncbi:MAG: response regulator [Spirochaetales bacterium]|nr:response regulator [Spirochaetales bacterium]
MAFFLKKKRTSSDYVKRGVAEDELRKSEEKLRRITDNISDVVWALDTNLETEYISPSIERLLGYTVEEYVKVPFDKKHPPDTLARIQEIVQTELQRDNLPGIDKDRVLYMEAEQYKADGSLIYTAMTMKIVHDKNGNIIGFQGVTRDISEKKRFEEQLEKAKDEAEQASKAKSEFLANMSHEIRTPLNGVIGFTDLLLQTPLTDTQRQYAENANVSGKILLGIINDILDFSKIEAGKLDLDILKTDLPRLMEDVVDVIKYQASVKGLELLLDVPLDIPKYAMLDPTRLKQVLLNLLNNAIKFTEFGEVELKLEYVDLGDSQGRFDFFVIDTGIGILPEQKDRLFKAFSQADTSTTRKYGGTGLGLIISNLLVEKMGGKILLDSEYGRGSTFYFSISTRCYDDLDSSEVEDLSDLPINKVLIVDDNAHNRMILEHNFSHWGLDYKSCESGSDALEILRIEKFDLLIIDYHMPGLDGLETIKHIRSDLHLTEKETPLIFLHSSSDDQSLRDECKSLGVNLNLVKPVKARELYSIIRGIKKKTAVVSNKKYSPAIVDIKILSDFEFNILIAEDVMMNMLLVKELVSGLLPHANLVLARSGVEAVDLAKKITLDFILMDIQMPELDGLEATRQIRALLEYKDLPIIALTAGALSDQKDEAIESGMDDFISKPVTSDNLRKIFEKYLKI